MSEPASLETVLARIVEQVEYYMSPENLSRDAFLVGLMDMHYFVPLVFIATFRRVRAITEDLAVIVEAMKRSTTCELDSSYSCIRPRNWAQLVKFPTERGLLIALRPPVVPAPVAAPVRSDGSSPASPKEARTYSPLRSPTHPPQMFFPPGSVSCCCCVSLLLVSLLLVLLQRLMVEFIRVVHQPQFTPLTAHSCLSPSPPPCRALRRRPRRDLSSLPSR